jgi:hypothetical protein
VIYRLPGGAGVAISGRLEIGGWTMVEAKIALTLMLFAALFLALYFTAIPG